MTRLAYILIAGLFTFAVLPGCGSGGTADVAADADQSAIDEYEAAVAQESEMMTEPE